MDRNVAKSCSVALSKWSGRNEVSGLVLATATTTLLSGYSLTVYSTALLATSLIGGYFGDLRSGLSHDLPNPKHGHFSADITISQETSIKVLDAGSLFGTAR